MPRVSAPVYAVNGGEVGEEALSRLDLERMQFASALNSNILPRVVGSMTLRPGLEHIADINLGDVRLLEYSFAGSNSSMLVPILSNNEMRILKDNTFVSRVAVATSITNGDFNSFAGWTDASAVGASANVSGGNLVLTGTTQGRAAARQTLSVAVGDRGKEHGLRIEVVRGPVWVHIGSSAGASDVLPLSVLDDGDHSIAFTPTTANVYIELYTDNARQALVSRCQIDAAGTLVLSTPWVTADLAAPRHKQNIDVLYLASRQFQQREIQRRGDTSWGVQRYKVDDGPFVASDGTVALTPSVYTGNGTLTASRPFFEASMLNRLFRLFQSGQTVQESFTASPANGASIRVSGVGVARRFSFQVAGTWVGSVRLEVATDDGSGNPGAWSTVNSYTANVGPSNYTDTDDNVVKFFRFVAVTYTSGTIDTTLIYTGGSQVGVARMTGYTSATVASVEVLSRFYSLSPTFEWDFSTWSDYDGWPWGIEAFGGRLYWGKGDFVHGSVPDAFHSFDDNVEGDSAPIYRSIGASTDRGILWLLGLQRLIAGTDNSEISIKASSFDEPLTASSWFPVDGSTQGSYDLRSVKCDKDGIFVQSSGLSVFALIAEQGTLDYSAMDLTEMHEEICEGSPIVSVAVQRQPDTIVWFILENGEARALTYRPSQKVVAWSRVVTDGQFKQVIACRGKGQDNVYFAVVRNGTQRLERLADLKDCRGGATNCLADGFKRFTTTASQTTFAVPHLNGKGVTVWVDGAALHDQDSLYMVAGGNVILPAQTAGKSVVIGLPYVGRWKSTKLAYGAANGTALFKKKRVSQLGLYLVKTMLDGLRAGKDFDTLRRLTVTKGDKPIAPNTLFGTFDADMMSVSSDWDTDSRICLEHRSPYPLTVGSLVMDVQTNG
ncbi:hypothetical protein [Aminobacter niigataensis]|uniref:hypothetical protein n=1 Tax=Aminobacter niigataensis TaxID=83265 RepID=UPI0024CC0AE6|nr:hypothetical protein [Aminobacter niigataensis]CAI2936245.1 conserved protein of unknown function [Aminobacter niigataensis]